MSVHDPYIIRGGLAGRERLRVLARAMHPTTAALFDRIGIGRGVSCLDVGCGESQEPSDLGSHSCSWPRVASGSA